MSMTRIFVSFLTVAMIFGCEDREAISVYDAPKDPPPATAPVMAAAQAGATGESHAGHGHEGELAWTAPAEWKSQPAGEMRFATYLVNENPPVQLTVIPLGPGSGEVLANVNRWEQQIGLPPTPADKLSSVIKQSKVNGLDVTAVDLIGKEQRMLAAIVPFGGRVWFFKAVGPTEIIAKQKENFDAYIASLKPGDGGGHEPPPAQAAPGQAAPAQAAPTQTMKVASFKAPDDWKEIPGSKSPRMIAFDIGPDEKKADLIVTRFASDNAGSFHDNVNRWRNQIGLPPVPDVREVQMSDAAAGKEPAVMIEIDNPGGAETAAKKVLVAMASVGPDLWFFKLTGPPDVIDKQRTAFDAFLKSLEFAPEGDAK